MLRVFCTNVMGRVHVSVNCYAHGAAIGHAVWSKSVDAGAESPEDELRALSAGLTAALRSWEQGEFDFTDDCFQTFTGGVRVPW
jgi:hypothetical protein